jgi:predicted RNA-binding Zn ribbon-like protein
MSSSSNGRDAPIPVGFRAGDPPLRLCLDFVNTEGAVRNDPPDRRDDTELFTAWAAERGLGSLAVPAGGTRFLERARELREALYRIFTASTRGTAPASTDLDVLNAVLGEAMARFRLTALPDGISWTLRGGDRAEGALELIALSAAKLLTSERLDRVKECASDTCSWMFLDESRNRSRRWCDMADCGNRAKARRYYQRHRSEDQAD